ncbi:MAG: hypothetical protein BWY91_02166 [bacterium ADurb.BinA028]|nr:MAG: hypothetical protein BWY91_02166 [bacterium ADurb.BinA028]
MIRPCSDSASSGDILPRPTARAVDFATMPLPRSKAWPSTSTATTDTPFRAKISAIPAPIVPSPMTPTVVNSRAIVRVSQGQVRCGYLTGGDGGHTRGDVSQMVLTTMSCRQLPAPASLSAALDMCR